MGVRSRDAMRCPAQSEAAACRILALVPCRSRDLAQRATALDDEAVHCRRVAMMIAVMVAGPVAHSPFLAYGCDRRRHPPSQTSAVFHSAERVARRRCPRCLRARRLPSRAAGDGRH